MTVIALKVEVEYENRENDDIMIQEKGSCRYVKRLEKSLKKNRDKT